MNCLDPPENSGRTAGESFSAESIPTATRRFIGIFERADGRRPVAYVYPCASSLKCGVFAATLGCQKCNLPGDFTANRPTDPGVLRLAVEMLRATRAALLAGLSRYGLVAYGSGSYAVGLRKLEVRAVDISMFRELFGEVDCAEFL